MVLFYHSNSIQVESPRRNCESAALQSGSKSYHLVQFRNNTVRKDVNTLIPLRVYGLNSILTDLEEGSVWKLITSEGWYAIIQRN